MKTNVEIAANPRKIAPWSMVSFIFFVYRMSCVIGAHANGAYWPRKGLRGLLEAARDLGIVNPWFGMGEFFRKLNRSAWGRAHSVNVDYAGHKQMSDCRGLCLAHKKTAGPSTHPLHCVILGEGREAE